MLRDSGTFSYYDPQGKWNHYFVSTDAHNTVVLGRTDQMEKGPRFRWFTLVRSRFLRRAENGPMELWQGEHYGYRRLPCRATHRRTICCLAEDCWAVIDDVLGEGSENVRLYWQLTDAPVELADQIVRLSTPHGPVWLSVCPSAEAEFRLLIGTDGADRGGWQSLYYGEKTPAPTLRIEATVGLPMRFVSVLCLGCEARITQCELGSLVTWEDSTGRMGRLELLPIGVDSAVIRAMQLGRAYWQIDADLLGGTRR